MRAMQRPLSSRLGYPQSVEWAEPSNVLALRLHLFAVCWYRLAHLETKDAHTLPQPELLLPHNGPHRCPTGQSSSLTKDLLLKCV